MDIENFIAEFKKTFVYNVLKDYVTDEKLFDHFVMESGDIVFLKEQTRQMWSMWQAAKAQAVLEVVAIGNDLQSWVAVNSFSADDGEGVLPVVDANALAEKIEELTGANQ